MSASLRTVVKRGMASESHQADEQKPTENLTGCWERTMEKIAHMPKDKNVFEAVEKTKECGLEEPVGDLVIFPKMKPLAATIEEVHLVVGTSKREVLWPTAEESRRDIFLNGYEKTEEGEQDLS